MNPFHRITIFLIVTACIFASGCSKPLLYIPSCDLNPVLTLTIPDPIKTLVGCPRDNSYVVDGINTQFGTPQPDNIKEMFDLRSGDTNFRFLLFFDDGSAISWYASEKRVRDAPIYKETSRNGLTGCLRYTEQPRSDPEGGSRPMGYYVSEVSFRLHNAYICVSTRHKIPESNSLTVAVEVVFVTCSESIPFYTLD